MLPDNRQANTNLDRIRGRNFNSNLLAQDELVGTVRSQISGTGMAWPGHGCTGSRSTKNIFSTRLIHTCQWIAPVTAFRHVPTCCFTTTSIVRAPSRIISADTALREEKNQPFCSKKRDRKNFFSMSALPPTHPPSSTNRYIPFGSTKPLNFVKLMRCSTLWPHFFFFFLSYPSGYIGSMSHLEFFIR